MIENVTYKVRTRNGEFDLLSRFKLNKNAASIMETICNSFVDDAFHVLTCLIYFKKSEIGDAPLKDILVGIVDKIYIYIFFAFFQNNKINLCLPKLLLLL